MKMWVAKICKSGKKCFFWFGLWKYLHTHIVVLKAWGALKESCGWVTSPCKVTHSFFKDLILSCQCVCECVEAYTLKSAIKMGVGGDLEAGMWHEETGDVGKAGMNVLPHVLQLLMLVLWNLHIQTHPCEHYHQNITLPLFTFTFHNSTANINPSIYSCMIHTPYPLRVVRNLEPISANSGQD